MFDSPLRGGDRAPAIKMAGVAGHSLESFSTARSSELICAFLHSSRNFLRSLPCRPLASACFEHSAWPLAALAAASAEAGGGGSGGVERVGGARDEDAEGDRGDESRDAHGDEVFPDWSHSRGARSDPSARGDATRRRLIVRLGPQDKRRQRRSNGPNVGPKRLGRAPFNGRRAPAAGRDAAPPGERALRVR